MHTALVKLITDNKNMSPPHMKEACESFECFRTVICEEHAGGCQRTDEKRPHPIRCDRLRELSAPFVFTSRAALVQRRR